MMKWLTLLAVLSLSLQPALAQTPAQTHVGLFIDDSHQSWCAFGTPVYDVELWIWVQPGAGGFTSVAFDMPYPGGTYGSLGIKNPDLLILPRKCKTACSWSFTFTACQTSWVWVYHEILTVSSADPMMIKMQFHPTGENYVAVWNCNDEEEQGVILSNLYINTCQPLPTWPTTWGAIKSLYGE